MILNKKNKSLIYISDNSINILTTNKFSISSLTRLDIEEGVIREGNIINSDIIVEKLKSYFDKEAININNISFVAAGSDIITRYIEVPIIKDEALRDAVEYEFAQFIPEIDFYYTDYEIVEKINTKEKKAYKILLVAVGKRKINSLVKISEELGKEIEAIDILANSLARVLMKSHYINSENSIGVFYLGDNNSNFSIVEDKALKIERVLRVGIKNILGKSYDKVKSNDIKLKKLLSLFKENEAAENSFNNMLNSINNTIRYYNSDKNNKPVGEIVLICGDLVLTNMEEYLSEYFNIPCKCITSESDLNIKLDFNNEFPKYMACYGLFERNKRDGNINLNPQSIAKEKVKSNLDKMLLRSTAGVSAVVAVILIIMIAMNGITSLRISSAEKNISEYTDIINENTELKNKNSNIESFINKITEIQSGTTNMSNIVEKLNVYIPESISFTNFAYDENKNIAITGECLNCEDIAIFLANLQMSEEFNSAKLNYINSGDTDYNFSMTIEGVEYNGD